jgi:CubicO group peptidase (beta-lactamase class C family)
MTPNHTPQRSASTWALPSRGSLSLPVSFFLPVIVAALCAGCSTPSPSSDVSGGITTGDGSEDPFALALKERMPALLTSNKVPGAVISCIRNGEVAWTKAFGLADLRTSSPMRPNMVLNHGSDGKVLTAWAMMRLVETGKVELDAPANRYLKRWQIRSTRFDANGVTPRRLISHTAGLTVHGFKDYEQGVPLPSLVDMLEGKNQDDGAVFINWEPGTTNVYSGGGFVIAQMIIEDVSGEPFAEFMRREVAKPLGLSSLEWVWAPGLQRRAPTPYDEEQKEVGYRQLASQAIGSEICTVSDFARFVAAAVPGPHNEPPGRGVLKPETISLMAQTQPNITPSGGLGYGIGSGKGEKFLVHAGGNPGWSAFFAISVERRDGYVVANNSSRGGAVNDAVTRLWLKACRPLP